jgi:hypothetical protein
MTEVAKLPGFRRRFRITPQAGCVCAEVEDDYHSMSVTVHHSEGIANAITPIMQRAPWTTCPGAVENSKKCYWTR